MADYVRIGNKLVERKYKMVKEYYIRVDGRCFDITEKEERKDELLELLPKFYPNSEITWELKRKRQYYYVR